MSFLKRFKTKKTKKKDSLPQNEDESSSAFRNLGPEQTEQIIACSTNAAFAEAWKMHWEDLSESEKLAWSFQEFKSPLKVQITTEDLNKTHLEQSVARKCADGVLKFLRAIETLMAGVTIGIQAYPDVSSIVIGVVRIIINVAVKYFEYYEKLTQMLERLADQLKVLDLFTQNNSKEPLLHTTLVAIYANTLAFCRHARRAFFNKTNMKASNGLSMLVKVQWAPFEEQFGQIQSNLKHYTENLDRISAAMTMNSTLAVHEEMKKKSSLNVQKERKRFLEWICKENIEETHREIRGKRLSDTGLWLLEDKNYTNWISHADTGLLWVYGPAGTGKSILASLVIDSLTKNDECTAYAYFKGEDKIMQQSTSQVLSMLVKQLCWNIDVLPHRVLELYQKLEKNARQPTFDDLKLLFTECVRHIGKVFVVFDGLDEFDERHRRQLLGFLCAEDTQQENVKFFVTSRWERDIKQAFIRCKYLKVESLSRTQSDLEKVVRHRVTNELSYISPDLQEEVIKSLIEKSGGVFLWASLQLNDLVQVPEPMIKSQLKELPTGLPETYLGYFRKINAQPQASRILAQRCFLWAFHAKKLLSSGQVMDAVSLDFKDSGSEMVIHNAQTLTEVTKNLLTITNLRLPRVRPVHFSLQEYVTNSPTALPSEIRDFLLPDTEVANEQLAILCLQHLIADLPPEDGLSTILFYAAHNFDGHIRSLTKIPKTLTDIFDRIFGEEQHKLLKILSWRWPIDHDSYPDISCAGSPSSVDPMFFMQCTGLDKVPELWSRYAGTERPRVYQDGYLHLATIAGLDHVIRDIIAQGLDVHRVDVDGHTALHYACAETIPLDTVKALVEGGVDINQRTSNGQSPLQLAREFRHVEKSAYLEEVGAIE
ncbi:hypothetical protein BGW36DRAFT_388130 [Talaromyces proteolyticus]|uniref:NACHT domain-containing protein n=1 Tax=Talaromyces proteolyticus TaxID=1131652 RepID=A0AAD4KM71_9EURO|nr:uncharacterized protein BGW36DRAFT_388130 [Talaromyces proteolyticus]KAH8691320.1 hypothetical protein BGW36DRAFT_388130 [Talaromyces proteolyticus]